MAEGEVARILRTRQGELHQAMSHKFSDRGRGQIDTDRHEQETRTRT